MTSPAETMRVAVLLAQFSAGGAERQTFELLRRLPRDEFEPQGIVLSDVIEPYGPALRELGVPVVTLPRTGSYDVTRLRRLRRLLAAMRPHLLHAIGYEPASYGLFATLGTGIALVPSIRSAILYPKVPKPLVYRVMFRAAPRAIFNSRRGLDFALRRFGANAARCEVIPNGLPFGEIETLAAAGPDARDVLGVPPGTPVAGFIGKDSWQKNVPRFLDVARRVSAAHPSVHFALVGWRLDREDRSRFGVTDPRIHFLGVRRDVYALLRGFSVLVVTSDTEGCPNVVLEAASLSVPIVAPDVGDIRLLLGEEGEEGLVRTQDPDEYSRRVGLCLAGGTALTERVARLRARILCDYDVDRMVARTADVYRSLRG